MSVLGRLLLMVAAGTLLAIPAATWGLWLLWWAIR